MEVWFYFVEKVVKFGDHSLTFDIHQFSEVGLKKPPGLNRVKETLIDKSCLILHDGVAT